MKFLAVGALAVLAGCASPDYVASRADFDVCRLSMGGPHAQLADAEARQRGLNCQAMYPAIVYRQAAENAAVQNYINTITPKPVPQTVCNSQRIGDQIRTVCR